MMDTIKSARNPQMMLQSMANNNPEIKKAMDYVSQNGGNAKQAFYALAKERGVDPNEIMNMLK